MARRRGRDVSGWVVVDKPAGPTSTQVTGRVRRAFNARKAGHAGTLDPAATGVLAVALGEATKTMPFVADREKTYRFVVRFGAATSTDDAEGEVVAESGARPTEAEIRAALPRFTGDILQVPPRFSAVHVGGRRAHEAARAGVEVELAARPLHVAQLILLELPDRDRAVLEMTCGKGGYVRSVARDLGADLGCLGHVESLRRVRAGPFEVAEAVALDVVEATPEATLRPVEAALAGVPVVACAPEAARLLRHGNLAPVEGGVDGATVWAAFDGQAVAFGTLRGGLLHPTRVLLHGAVP